jgi:hypothetical protein
MPVAFEERTGPRETYDVVVDDEDGGIGSDRTHYPGSKCGAVYAPADNPAVWRHDCAGGAQ